jgi:cysteine desulfurase
MELAIVELPETMKRVGRLRDKFEKAMLAKVRESIVNGGKRRVPNTSNIRFAGIESEAMLLKLDMERIAASAGSACSTGSASASHVLIAMGLAVREAASSVRFSLGKFTTDEEIEYAVKVVPRVVEHLREVAARA